MHSIAMQMVHDDSFLCKDPKIKLDFFAWSDSQNVRECSKCVDLQCILSVQPRDVSNLQAEAKLLGTWWNLP